MDAETGVFPDINKPKQDEDKHQRMASLMDKLRARNPQHKVWTDSKLVKAPNMAEKRHVEATDKVLVQNCLDSIQRAIKVCNHQSLLERLESIARQVGLTYNTDNDLQVFISSDMFFIEIQLEKGGIIKDVKIVHQGDPMSCPELTEILQDGKFEEFITHLEGLQKIYQLTGDKKIKTKGYLALQSIEKDLNTLAQLQSSTINGVARYIHKTPLGILLPRKGGLPMELMYFVSPYDLLDKLSKTAHPLTLEAITEFNLGQRVTICMEPGPPKKLQTMPLMTINKTSDGKSLPSYTNISNINSHLLPACFTLVLKQPIPVSLSVVQKIQSITNIDFGEVGDVKPLLNLLIEKYSQGKIQPDQIRQLYVNLPDQHHTYFINGVNGGSLDQPGLMVSSVPFVHPTSVPRILNCLRQQLLFNTVVSSVIRPNSIKETQSSVVCELTTISMQQLTVTFEHPAHDDIISVEIDLADITNLKCKVVSTSDESLCSDDLASRIFQRCMSVPITVRTIFKKGKDLLQKATDEAKAAMRPPTIPPRVIKPRPPPPYIPPPQQLAPPILPANQQQMDIYPAPPPYSSIRSMSHEMVSPPNSVEKTTPLLANLLDHDGDTPTDSTDSPMLSRLLEEQPTGSVITLPPGPIPQPQPHQQHHQQQQQHHQQMPSLSQMPVLQQHMMVPQHQLASQQHQLASQQHQMASQQQQLASQQQMASQQQQMASQQQQMTSQQQQMVSQQQQQMASQQQHQMASHSPNLQQQKRMRKRRSATEVFTGRSPKHRISDSSGGFDRFDSFDMDNSSSPFDAGGGGSIGGSSGLGGNFQASGSLGSVIDLTEDAFSGESNLKKLADSVDSLIPREMSRQASIPDSELSALLAEGEVGGRPLISRSSPQNSKNEKASISLEGLLSEVGDNDEADDPILASRHLVSAPGPRSDNQTQADTYHSTLDVNIRNELFGTDLEPSKSVQQLMTHRVPQSHDLLDSKYSAIYGKSSVKVNSDLSDKKEITGIFEKLENLKGEQLKKEKTDPVDRPESGGSMKLKLSTSGFRGGEGRLISSPAYSSEPVVTKKSGSTFDFPSDESDEEPPSLGYSGSERLSMTVYSQSPTRLQISNKAKNSNDSLLKKSEKYKRKEAKYSLKGDSVKRKKLKDESKKERKKRKMTESQYVQPLKEAVYHSVESDQRTVTKLKIRVAKEPTVVQPDSPDKDKFGDNVKKQTVEKYVVSRQDSKEFLKSQKSLHRSKSSSNSQGSSESGKTDPKLAKATIRLKPLQIPNPGSSVTVNAGQKSGSASGKSFSEIKSVKSSSSNKTGNSGNRTASPSITSASYKSPNSNLVKTSSPSVGQSASSPILIGSGKTASPSVSKSVISPNLSSTGKISSPNLSGSGKINSPSLSSSGKTSSPISSASSKSSSPSISGLAKSTSVNKTYNSANKSGLSKSGSGSSNKTLSSSKSGSNLNSSRLNSSSSGKSSSLSKSSSTSSLGSGSTSMSMSAYLPNAPSASKVARLPPIPKLSSSSKSASQASSISHSSALHSPPPQTSAYTSTSHTSSQSSNSTTDSGTNSTNKNKANLPPMARARKGSLSAVIDKLTKATGTTNSVSDSSGLSEAPVSRDPRINNSKSDKISDRSVQSEKSNFSDKKVPRPDSINIDKFGNKQRSQENYVSKQLQKSPTTNKMSKSDYNKRQVMNSDYSSHNKSRSLSDTVSSSPRLNSILTSSKTSYVSSPTTKSSPVGILKNSQTNYNSEENRNTKVSDSGNFKRERSHTPTTPSQREDPRLIRNNSSSNLNSSADNSKTEVEKLKVTATPNIASPSEGALDLSISDKIIPTSNVAPPHGSTVVPDNVKFNGEVTKAEKTSSKQPTLKSQTPQVRDNNMTSESPKNKVPTPNKSSLSPQSDASSPGAGLIIDCPASPDEDITPIDIGTKGDNCVKSDTTRTVATPPSLKTPLKTTSSKDPTPPVLTASPISNSPCEIDDDLMDQALLGLGE